MSKGDYWWIGPVLQMPVMLFTALRGSWTPRFPRAWRGRHVTVCAHEHTHKVKMERIDKDHFDLWALEWEEGHPPPRAFYFKDEGVTWVMGWRGPVVDAFKTAVALRAA